VSDPGTTGAAPLRRPPEWYRDHPHARSSFSRLATYKRCPGWYRYQYLDWHRAWSPPVTRAGQVVQEAFERILDVGPAQDIAWEDIEDRALQRATARFGQLWKEMQGHHNADPNGLGPWVLRRATYETHLHQALRFHLAEVKARLDRVHPRTGAVLDLPALTTVRDAWFAVRPHHAPPGTPPMDSMECVPAGFFQGQCDLIYDWTGERRLVDLKSSSGKSAFSTEIRVQLLAYSWLDRELGHGRPAGMEAWFLGLPDPMVFDVPEDDELDAFAEEVCALIVRSGHEESYGSWRAEDFPTEPAQVPGHSPRGTDPSGWCRFCPATSICERSSTGAPPVGDGVTFGRVPAQAPPSGLSVEGIILGVGEPIEKKGVLKRRFTLANASGALSSTWNADVVLRLVEQGLRAGRHVRITGLNPWAVPNSTDVLLFPTPVTALSVLTKDRLS
jgi:PD-(D/E)XK nuclease superfamily